MAVYRYDPNNPEASRISAGLRAAGVGTGTTAPQVRTQLDPDESYLKWTTARDAKAIEDWKNQTQNDMKSFWSALSGAGSGVSASDSLAARKYQDELAKEKRQIEAYQQMLQGGGYRAGADRMLGLIGEQGKVSEGAAKKAYTDALANILGGFETAQSLTGEGYGALENYLRQNPNNPYADVRVSAGQAPDAMEQILSAYGVSADPVRAQVAAEQAAAQQGASGFQNLLNTLGASAQQSDASRLAEMMMAQNLAQTTLGQQRFGYQSQAEQAQANALAQIQAQLAQARLEQEAGVETRRQGIEDAIAAAGGVLPPTGGQEDKTQKTEKKDEPKKKDSKKKGSKKKVKTSGSGPAMEYE